MQGITGLIRVRYEGVRRGGREEAAAEVIWLKNVPLSAPEAQCLLAPRFSVGDANFRDEIRNPVGTAQEHFYLRGLYSSQHPV
jgi:hypothetical protein